MTGKQVSLPPGLTLIKWRTCKNFGALCSKVGFFFIISCFLAWLPCCNTSSFSRFLSHITFLFPKRVFEKKVFSTFSSSRCDTVGDDVMEAYQRRHPDKHLPGLMFCSFAQNLPTNRACSTICRN